ncbi:hypothetical protein SALBM311S_00301 [Streptomyces alboniger]
MQIADSVALVTGAGRGLGRHFATQLLRGHGQVYAAARRTGRTGLACLRSFGGR